MEIAEMILTGLQIQRGRIVAISDDGEIMVESGSEDLPLPCEFLRTSAGPLPELRPGDAVLYAMDENARRGYVLGVIQKYHAGVQGTNGQLIHSQTEQAIREIKFNAAEKIELRCGKSSLSMDKDGKVVIKGSQLTSRASGLNRVKGAAVKIN